MPDNNSRFDHNFPKFSGKALFVDDDEIFLKMGSALLGAFGFEVLLARDGVEAVEMFQSDPEAIAIVILDLVMPRMSGVEAAEKIRQLHPSAKVILSSGYLALLPQESVADAILPKPYEVETLHRLIQQLLKQT